MRTVLVIEDELQTRNIFLKCLEFEGFRAFGAGDGATGMELALSQRPDLIVCDIMMPDMDGYQVCQELKKNSQTKDIILIFLSSLDCPLDRVKAFKVGGIDYISKPFHKDEVIIRIENQLTIKNQKILLEKEIEQRKKIEKKLIEKNEKLEHLANLDGLTRIGNRRLFDRTLSKEWQRATREKQPLSLILSDVDYFKLYNDYYGHQMGDDCLKKVAKAITEVIKRPADLVARYGGEEFAVILPNTELNGAIHVGKLIRDRLKQQKIPHESSKIGEWVTVSSGVATMIPTLEVSLKTLIANADSALYQAKKNGRDRVVPYVKVENTYCINQTYFETPSIQYIPRTIN